MRESWSEIKKKFNNKARIPIPGILEVINNKRFILKDQLEIYPSNENIFRCMNFQEINKIKVVIIGQDPYHGPNQATGLAFAVPENSKIPPSLNNIRKELKDDLKVELVDTTLESWAKQGILLLNTSLTVIQAAPASQMALWNEFTDYIISELNNQDGLIFVAWGAFAHNKLKNIDKIKHKIIISSHPSPLSYFKKYKEFHEFKGSKPFSKINKLLEEQGKDIINW